MMADIKSLLKPVFRRSSTTTSAKSDLSSTSASSISSNVGTDRRWGKSSLRLGKNKKPPPFISVHEEKELLPAPRSPETSTKPSENQKADSPIKPTPRRESLPPTPLEWENPRVIVEQPSPEQPDRSVSQSEPEESPTKSTERLSDIHVRPNSQPKLSLAARRHSPITFSQSSLFSSPGAENPAVRTIQSRSHLRNRSYAPASMQRRKIWVKRPSAVPTQVSIGEEDLVDDVKDMVLRKYSNSLGRNFDPPDVTLKAALGSHSSRHTNEKILGPDENIFKVLDMHYPSGQSIDEALIIDVPQRRTPKHSPRVAMPYYFAEDLRPGEHAGDYFPPMPINGPHSPHMPSNLSVSSGHGGMHRPAPHAHSISVLETGLVPNLPSPGGTSGGRVRHSDRSARPRYGRQHTSSPTVLSNSNHNQAHGERGKSLS